MTTHDYLILPLEHGDLPPTVIELHPVPVLAAVALLGIGLGVWLGWQAHAVRMADEVTEIRIAQAEQVRADRIAATWNRMAEANYRKSARIVWNAEKWAAEGRKVSR